MRRGIATRSERAFVANGSLWLSLLVLGCVPAPQTRQEFVRVVGGGTSFSTHESFAVSQPLSGIEKTLGEKSATCLNKTIEKWGAGAAPGSRMKSTATYVSFLERNPQGQLELTFRVRHNPRGIGSPPDGVFLLAADLNERGKETAVEL